MNNRIKLLIEFLLFFLSSNEFSTKIFDDVIEEVIIYFYDYKGVVFKKKIDYFIIKIINIDECRVNFKTKIKILSILCSNVIYEKRLIDLVSLNEDLYNYIITSANNNTCHDSHNILHLISKNDINIQKEIIYQYSVEISKETKIF